MRPSWDEYFIKITKLVAERSTCLRRQVGAIIVKNNRIITTGYNGAPQNMEHCENLGGCMREKLGIPSGERHEICRATHAEQNAIIQAAVMGVSIDGGTCYVTDSPCSLCAKMLINSGIKRIVFIGRYPDDLALDFFKEAGIILEQYDIGDGSPRQIEV